MFIGRTDTEAETPILWPPYVKSQLIGKDPDAGKDWRWEERRGWQRMRWLDGINNNGHEFEQTLGDSEGQGNLVCCSPWGHRESDMTEQLNNNNNKSIGVDNAIQPSYSLSPSSPPALNRSQHQSFFPMSWVFASGDQSIGASASVLPMNMHGWFPLGFTDWISLQSKGLSKVVSNTTVQKHQFFSAHPC